MGGRKIPLDLLSEKFFDDYIISWVTPYLNNSIADVNIGSLGNAVTFNALAEALLLTTEIFTTQIMYDFLSERWTFSDANGIGSPYRAVNATNYYELFYGERNYSFIYRLPGFMLYLPTYRRMFQNSSNLANETVNALLFTPPVNLAWASIYARNGTLCGHVPRPRANQTYTVSCGFDPFLYDAEYLTYLDYLSAALNQSTTIEQAFVFLKAFATEGVRVNLVPEDFYGIELSPYDSFSTNYTDSCTPSDTGYPPGLNGTCHYWRGTDTLPNYGEYYYYDWVVNQGWTPEIQSGNGTLNNFYYWFNLSFTQSSYDLTLVWQNFQQFPLNLNVNQSLPTLDCAGADYAYCVIVWETWLSSRFCTYDAECINNALGDVCLFDNSTLAYIPWLNGDGIRLPGGIGQEGGCYCYTDLQNGYHDELCQVCLSGYGPPENCTYPYERDICATPDATLNITQFNETGTLQIVDGKVPSCKQLIYQGRTYDLVPDSFVYLEQINFLVSYIDSDLNIINIIDDEVWSDDRVIEVEQCVTYTQDIEYQVQYFDTREISFIPFVNFCSFIHYFNT